MRSKRFRGLYTIGIVMILISASIASLIQWDMPGYVAKGSSIAAVTGTDDDDNFGWNVSFAGDVNGDGYDDVIVGAPGYDNNRGRAYIFFGGPWLTGSLVADNANVTINGSSQGDRFGWDVSEVGDMNNDDYDDVIVGAPGYNSNTGAAYIFYGNNSMPSLINDTDANVTFFGERPEDRFGSSVSTAGDVNNDNYCDVIVGAPYHDNWWNDSWSYRQKLTFNNSGQTETLVNFPVLINLSSSNFNYSRAKLDGTDLRFIDSDDFTELKCQIEEWNPSGNSYVWVNVTHIPGGSSSDYIWMYYGNQTASDIQDPINVWDSGYQGIWHLNESVIDEQTIGTHFDTTGNHHGTQNNNDEAACQIANGQDFDNNIDYINLGDLGTNSWTAITMEAWIYHRDTGDDRIICKSIGTAIVDHTFSLGTINNILRVRLGTDGVGGGTTSHDSQGFISPNTWYHVAFTWDSADATIRFWGNGQDQGTSSRDGDTINDSSQVVIIGNVNLIDNRYFNGFIDEVRISNIARSADWIKAQYLSMNNGFITFGFEETLDWWDDNWSYRKQLVFDNSGQSEDLVNFPVLVNLSAMNFDYSKAKADGTDLRFIDSDGSTQLNYHIEEWNTSGYSYIWVNVTHIPANSNSDYIWMYYGNAPAPDVQDIPETYNTNYVGVWHLNETVTDEQMTGTHYDSTSNKNDGSQNGSDDTSGKIYKGQYFDGIDDTIDCGNKSNLDVNYITIEFWLRVNNWTSDGGILAKGNNSYRQYWIWTYGNEVSFEIDEALYQNYAWSPSLGQWEHLVLTYNGTNVTTYRNGLQENIYPQASGVIDPTLEPLLFGYIPGYNYFNGSIDEVRISNIARSPAWIKAQYLSMNGSFVTFGSDEYKAKGNGAAYVFYGNNSVSSPIYSKDADVILSGSIENGLFGFSVSDAGDVNNDGFDDVVVGAPRADKVYIYYGNDPMDTQVDLILNGIAGESFGFSVSGAGDVNNNGYNDIIIGAPHARNWWNDSWLYRQKLTFNNSGQSETLVNFPVLVNLSALNFNYSRARSDGLDLRFLDSDGITELKYHIEEWNTSAASYIWVNVTRIDMNSDTDYIWMYYGNSGASNVQDISGTYNDNYAGVWHLNEDPAVPPPQYIDSSSNDNDGTANASMASDDLVLGKIGGGIDFDGIDDSINIPQNLSLDIPDNITISGWFKLDNPHNSSSPTSHLILEKYFNANYNLAIILAGSNYDEGTGGLSQGALVFKMNVQNGGDAYAYKWTFQTSWSADTWYHFNCIINVTDNTENKIYINAVEDVGGQREGVLTGVLTYNADWNIGGGNVEPMNIPLGEAYFDGVLDEIQIMNTICTVDWIRAQYLSMNNSFITYGICDEKDTSAPGRAFIFDGSFISVEAAGDRYIDLSDGDIANVTFTGESSNDLFGYSVSSAGNFTNYLFSHVIVGAPNANGNGAAYVFCGGSSLSSNIYTTSADFIEFGENPADCFGWSVSGAGDVIEADGYDEILIGAPHHDPLIKNNAGRVYIIMAKSRPLIRDVLAIPSVQESGGYVNITCNVTDDIGVSEVWVNITLPGGGYSNATMTQEAGSQWFLNNTYPIDGLYQYTIWACDSSGNWINSSGHVFALVASGPQLTGPGVTPAFGDMNMQFNFTVSYSHSFDKAPDSITLNLTGPSGGTFNLVEVDPFDSDYTDGKLYYYILSGLNIGSYSFHFAANDTDGNWTETAEIFQPFVANRLPSLSSPQVNPASGYIDTWFNFTVTYTDLDNHAPDKITVNITGLGIYDLIEVDSLDVDYTDGKSYYVNISSIPLGTSYTFHFAANDTIGDWVEGLEIGGPDVINRAPMLSLEQVTPNTGFLDTWFNFRVVYTDLDNNPPDTIAVNITGIGIYDLLEVDPFDMNYSDGKVYYYDMTGIAINQYTFHFAANDTMGNWTESSSLQFDVVNSAPELSGDGVNPTTGYSDTGFNFTVIYTDLDGHNPDIITANITGLGIYVLTEADPSDTDYTDGKSYYINISTIPIGTFYTFHFAANDTLGNWIETSEINAPDVLQRTATLTSFDETVEYSDNAFLNASLMESGTPIAGEDVEFYIDMNDNGIYEPGELVGSATTIADGSVSVIYNAYLVPNSYDFAAVYTGSGGFLVGDDESLLTVNPKQSTLTALSDIVEEGEVTALTATLIDDDGNQVANEHVDLLLDKNQNGIYEGSELIGSSATLANGVASITFTANLLSGDYDLWARYAGSGNYSVSEIVGLLIVQNTSNNPPVILGIIPDQIKPEDSLPWTLDLTSYEADVEDTNVDLKWYLTGIDTNLYSVTGLNSTDDVFTFILQENAFGNDEVILWLVDGNGDRDSQVLWINITPVNDLPYFDPLPPNLFVHYDDPSIEDDDPAPWNYSFYVHDIETPIENLILTTSEPTVDSGDGYADVDGLEVTFYYPQSMVGESILVTLTIDDGTDTAQTMITVNVTSDWVPELVSKIPDIIIEENTTIYNAFDLDDYFTDRDHDSLFFSSGYFHLIVEINPDNTVDITAMEQWTGSELITFRAEDPTGAIVEDTITVTVVMVNDGPEISGAPDLNVHFDYSYGFDFSPYISDPDNSASELSLWTSESTDYIWLQQLNNLGIVVNYPMSMNGATIPVTIFVSDGIDTASQEILITISDNFPPELMYKLPDVSFAEDTFLEDAILLSYYFLDIDGDALFFSNGSTFINVTINDDLTVDFGAPRNWYGFEKVTFRATDPTGSIAEDTILVVVVPVNDPPTIESIPNQEKNEGDQWVLDLSPFIYDVDNNASELIITVESEAGNGYVTLAGNILLFQYPNGISSDTITITVSDGELETSRNFTVTLKTSTPVAPSSWDMIPWLWILFIFLAAIGGAFAFYMKKGSYQVHEAFLIHEKGLPIAHVSSEESSEFDDLAANDKFTEVQDFINDAISGKIQDDDSKLGEMKFKDNKILIEKSQDLYLAAIFKGNGDKLGNRMRKILADINKKYGYELTEWDGDMTKLVGISAMIVPLIPKRPPDQIESEQSSAEDQSEVQSGEFEGQSDENGLTHGKITERGEEFVDNEPGHELDDLPSHEDKEESGEIS